MKQILLILLVTIELISDTHYELKLYESILPTLFQKKSLTIYTQEREQKNILKNSLVLKLSNSCSNADLIIADNLAEMPEVCISKPLFTTSYRSYRDAKNTFGAFYWRKGRPQIHFKLETIKRYNLHLPNYLQKYAK